MIKTYLAITISKLHVPSDINCISTYQETPYLRRKGIILFEKLLHSASCSFQYYWQIIQQNTRKFYTASMRWCQAEQMILSIENVGLTDGFGKCCLIMDYRRGWLSNSSQPEIPFGHTSIPVLVEMPNRKHMNRDFFWTFKICYAGNGLISTSKEWYEKKKCGTLDFTKATSFSGMQIHLGTGQDSPHYGDS